MTDIGQNFDFYANMLGSTTAGFIGRTLCHPIDTAKSRLQSSEFNIYNNTLSVIRDLYQKEGLRGLYRGYGAVAVGGVPGTCMYLTAYETAKEKLLKSNYNISPFAVYFTSGIIAETFCCVIFVPVDVVKERLQVQRQMNSSSSSSSQYQYRGSFDAAVRILQTEGLHGIYKGYAATLLSYGPFSALYFLLYEEIKKRVSGESDISFAKAVISSAVAGAIASYITSPLDMAKLRLQIQRIPSASPSSPTRVVQYTSLGNVLVSVYAREGLRGLFRGAGARVFFHTPSTAITMGLFEECKRFWMNIISK